MHGHKIYEFAITKVPQALKDCLEASGKSINDVKKIFLHQANEKMDDAMVDRLYKTLRFAETRKCNANVN